MKKWLIFWVGVVLAGCQPQGSSTNAAEEGIKPSVPVTKKAAEENSQAAD